MREPDVNKLIFTHRNIQLLFNYMNLLIYGCYILHMVVLHISKSVLTIVPGIFHNPVKDNQQMLKGALSKFYSAH
jgi:hypothetical protein